MGGTGLVAVYIKKNTDSGNLYYVCTDRQGSITALINPDGSVAEKYSYDAYGRRRNPLVWTDYNVPAPSLINRGYTGHEMLDGFGLINMNGRMYDPVIGRVLSPDIAVQAPGYTQSYNRYSYCMNNPLRYTDPSGWYMMLSNGSVVGQDFNDWGISNSANLGMPGSGGNWSDGMRSVYGNYMMMGASVFQNYYGISRDDYNNSIVPNYRALPKTRSDFQQKSSGERGFYGESRARVTSYSISAADENGNSNGTINMDVVSEWVSLGANSGGRGWLTAADWLNNTVGGFGMGMIFHDGTFRLNNSGGFSPKFYNKSLITGRGWTGGGRGLIKTLTSAKYGNMIGRYSTYTSLAIGLYNVGDAFVDEGFEYGINTKLSLSKTSVGIAGAYAGAQIGAAFGVWFYGVGAVPGAIIGGVIGGFVGGLGGSELGEGIYNMTNP